MTYNAAILEAAGRHLGLEEWPGAASNPAVEVFFARAGHPGLTDDVPWCAAFVGAVLAECGLPTTGSLMARSYARWGRSVGLSEVMPGDVAVLSRGQPPSGHVGFVVRLEGDRVVLRGGNQGNAVSDASYPISRVIGFRRADPAATSGRPVLRQGDRGAFVIDIQDQLHELGYASGEPDGIFGPLTRSAVMAFQADNDLEADGIVGDRTWRALPDAAPRPERPASEAGLREAGSRTIRNADQAQVGTAATVTLGAGTAALERADEAVAAIEDAQGLADRAMAVASSAWPVLAILVVGIVVWGLLSRVKKARVDDARSGRNLGR